MPLSIWPAREASLIRPCIASLSYLLSVFWCLVICAQCMTDDRTQSLRKQTLDLFYHGFDSYMLHAFPEDELKPLTCQPLTRDRTNPAHIEVNDVLGNYSLTLIDSLSTLAIFASSAPFDGLTRSPLDDFQDGIASLVDLYGDGTDGSLGTGSRAKGFDLDSKVQVFETVIRGVGGLLSAHLFAVGELPIRGYDPSYVGQTSVASSDITWENGFVYNGQLLRLAQDLAERIVPAFHTVTGLPYPRVNLRHGVQFYPNSPLNYNITGGRCEPDGEDTPEITETCSAGAGSLVLEFTVLSRLTGDGKYEQLAKQAFHAVWERRSIIGLIGAGIDAESGLWVAPFTGIGAGVGSFFQHAVDGHVLLSGLPEPPMLNRSKQYPDFLDVWHEAHSGIKRHLYRGSAYQHPHYVQGDVYTGATRAFWIDSLSAYYPGLLTLSGELDEAIETHMLFTALWTRYSALPERWSTASGSIDQGLRWWPGRPEFIESTWYLYRATKDPWYLHVGEMVLEDIKRRCWTECGWAGLEDVRTGELKDRMESFFLGETAKYLFLLLDPLHPLNKWDAPWVFTTEGHPLIIPKKAFRPPAQKKKQRSPSEYASQATCPLPPALLPFSISATAARSDLFHAASLARLQHVPRHGVASNMTVESSLTDPSIAESELSSPTNYTFYPWTLPMQYVPYNGSCSMIESRVTFDLSFPIIANTVSGPLTLRRVGGGISINSVSGIKFSMIRERHDLPMDTPGESRTEDVFRIHAVSHLSLGRDESVTIAPEVVADLNPVDPFFTRHRELSVLDIVIDSPKSVAGEAANLPQEHVLDSDVFENLSIDLSAGGSFSGWLSHLSSIIEQKLPLETVLQGAGALLGGGRLGDTDPHQMMEASAASGLGAGPLPDIQDASLNGSDGLPWTTIYMAGEMCDKALPAHVAKNFQVILAKRGGCTFSDKMRNIPSFAPHRTSLQLVIIVSYPELEVDGAAIRPLLDEIQYTPHGVQRPNQIPMLMVEGGDDAYYILGNAKGLGLRRRYHFSSQGLRISNLYIV